MSGIEVPTLIIRHYLNFSIYTNIWFSIVVLTPALHHYLYFFGIRHYFLLSFVVLTLTKLCQIPSLTLISAAITENVTFICTIIRLIMETLTFAKLCLQSFF